MVPLRVFRYRRCRFFFFFFPSKHGLHINKNNKSLFREKVNDQYFNLLKQSSYKSSRSMGLQLIIIVIF